jgi:hypothetical protein
VSTAAARHRGAPPRLRDLVHVCSWCRNVRVGAEWVGNDEGLRRLGPVFRAERRLSHGICPACFDRVAASLD